MERDGESILGLDNIELELPVAGIGSRTLAAVLDYVILSLLLVGWLVFCFAVVYPLDPSWGLTILSIGSFLLQWGYFAGFEIGTGGRTPGKMAMTLRVVSSAGGRAGAGSLLARNLVRLIDFVVGLPLVVLDPKARRLGDWLAGTLVVHDRRPELAGREIFLGRVPAGWGAREVAVVEQFLVRAGELADVGQRDAMALRLLQRVAADAPELVAGISVTSDPVAELRQALAVGQR